MGVTLMVDFMYVCARIYVCTCMCALVRLCLRMLSVSLAYADRLNNDERVTELTLTQLLHTYIHMRRMHATHTRYSLAQHTRFSCAPSFNGRCRVVSI